ncbi:hypothetical protein GW17_00048157 [Ensete ventricosum]|nr:hypothetical protein GW17_00048157 [Ensete ventricosum]
MMAVDFDGDVSLAEKEQAILLEPRSVTAESNDASWLAFGKDGATDHEVGDCPMGKGECFQHEKIDSRVGVIDEGIRWAGDGRAAIGEGGVAGGAAGEAEEGDDRGSRGGGAAPALVGGGVGDPGEVAAGVKEERKLLHRGAQGKREGEGRGGFGCDEEGRCFTGRRQRKRVAVKKAG